MKLVAIVPTGKIVNVPGIEAAVDRELRNFAVGLTNRMAKYPPQRAGRTGRVYRRTGTLGRGWQIGVSVSKPAAGSIEVANNVAYARHVQGVPGPGGQRPVMAAIGWRNIETESDAEWARHSPQIRRAITP